MKYPSHGFLASRWFVHSQSMGLGNPFKALVYYLLIEEMVGLGNRDRFVIVSALVYMVIH